jgi:hypothetical protein
LKLRRFEALCQEQTKGKLEDRVYSMPSFLPSGCDNIGVSLDDQRNSVRISKQGRLVAHNRRS